MATQQQLDLVFELDVKKAEKKVANPTKNLMVSILQEAGFDGEWQVRDSRQIKKRGRERFGVIRLESRVGRASIRVWCKPRGNETCFEYSLIPPSGVDVPLAFAVLKKVNGITLRIPELGTIPLAVEGMMLGIPTAPKGMDRVAEVREAASQASVVLDASEGAAAEERGLEVQHEPVGRDEADAPPCPDDESEFPSLRLHLGETGSSAMDKALVAVGFVAVEGYAKKEEAFDSIVQHLGLCEIARQKLVSVEESLRICASAMKDTYGYIRRVRHSSKDRKAASDSIMGFKLTGRGQERLDAVRSSYGPEVEMRLGERWRLAGSVKEASEAQDAPSVEDGVAGSQASSAVLPDALVRIKTLLASYEEAIRQVSEHDQVIRPIDESIGELEKQIAELDRSGKGIEDKIKELRESLEGISSRKSELQGEIDKKSKEKGDWEALKEPHSKEKSRVESILSGLGVLK